MSLVMVFATQEFVVLSGDLRMTSVKDDSIYYDVYPKAFQINQNVLAGFTGDVKVTNELREELKDVEKTNRLEEVTEHVEKLLSEKWPDAYQTVHLAGISNDGNCKIAILTHRNKFKTEYVTVGPNEIKWQVALAYVDPRPLIDTHYNELMESDDDINAESIAKLAKKVNEEVSENDVRVSKDCVVVVLKPTIEN